jgi:hypothetical protein
MEYIRMTSESSQEVEVSVVNSDASPGAGSTAEICETVLGV